MAIKFAPPWLKKLAAVESPLVDDADVQREVAQLKVQFEQEERQLAGILFAGPMRPSQQNRSDTPALTDLLPEREAAPSDDRFDQPMAPPAPPAAPPPGVGGVQRLPGELTTPDPAPPGFFAPPGAPPPPPPADRPPGTFRFGPDQDPDTLREDDVLRGIRP